MNDAELRSELLRMTDAYTDNLFPVAAVEAGRVVFPVSRLVCDVERFASDNDEPMAARGMGVIYTRTSLCEPLRSDPTPLERQHVLDRWYWPHHLKLERLVNDVLSQVGQCTVIDCHSFPSAALPYELDHPPQRADICVGTDPFHTPSFMRDAVVRAANEMNFSVAVDAPFAGALVPIAHFRKDRRVSSVMIEVNRRLYMDEQTGLKHPDFARLRDAVHKLIDAIAGVFPLVSPRINQ